MTNQYVNLPDLVEALKAKGYTVTNTADTSLTVDSTLSADQMKAQLRAAKKTTLTEEELDAAVNGLVKKWPRVEKRFADPPIVGQQWCLSSFMPAKGAKPDPSGLYGYIKFRGAFSNQSDLDSFAENLIETVDSYHAINQGVTGEAMPLVQDEDDRYCMEQIDVGMSKKIANDLTDNAREQQAKVKAREQEAREYSEKLKTKAELEDAAIKNGDPKVKYDQLRMKRANLIFTLYQMISGAKRYKDTLVQTMSMLDELDAAHPHFAGEYLEHYKKTIEETGLPADSNHIVRYLVGPVPFDINVIPDTIQVIPAEQVILPIDVANLDHRQIAETMYKSTLPVSVASDDPPPLVNAEEASHENVE